MARIIIAGNACVEINVPLHETQSSGETIATSPFTLDVGGSAVNTAVAASRMGLSVVFAGVIGDDLFGQMIRDRLARDNVDVTRLKVLAGRTSPTTLVQPVGKRQIQRIVHPGTNADYQLPDNVIKAPCRIFHLAAPEQLTSIWPRAATEMVRQLKVAGQVVSLDPCIPEGGTGDTKHLVREYQHILDLLDIVFPNEREALLISGRREVQSVIRYFHERGVKVVVIKRAERGAIVSWQGRMVNVRTKSVDAVDTRGAGDCFSAAFLAAYIKGHEPVQCARLACTVATNSVAADGVLAGTEDTERLEKLLAGLEHA